MFILTRIQQFLSLGNSSLPTITIHRIMMHKALIGKNKFKFVDGSIPASNPFHPSYDAWERCNNPFLSWIINYVSSSIAQSIIYKYLVCFRNVIFESDCKSLIMQIRSDIDEPRTYVGNNIVKGIKYR